MVYPALLPLMRTPRLPAVDWTDAPRRFKWTRPFRTKDEIWFLRVCHHISNAVYLVCPDVLRVVRETSYGIRVGFTGSDEVLTTVLFIYLFIRIWGENLLLSTPLSAANRLSHSTVSNGSPDGSCQWNLTLILLTWRIWWDPGNASIWHLTRCLKA